MFSVSPVNSTSHGILNMLQLQQKQDRAEKKVSKIVENARNVHMPTQANHKQGPIGNTGTELSDVCVSQPRIVNMS